MNTKMLAYSLAAATAVSMYAAATPAHADFDCPPGQKQIYIEPSPILGALQGPACVPDIDLSGVSGPTAPNPVVKVPPPLTLGRAPVGDPPIVATIPDNLATPREPILATIPDNLPTPREPILATIPDNLSPPAVGPSVIGPPGYQPPLPPDPPWCPDGTPRPPDRPCRYW